MNILLAIAAAVCAIGWISTRISVMAILRYLDVKGYTLPSEEETRACARWAARKTFHKFRCLDDQKREFKEVEAPEVDGQLYVIPDDEAGTLTIGAFGRDRVKLKRKDALWLAQMINALSQEWKES